MAFEPLVAPSRLNRPDQFAEEAELCLNGIADFIEKYNELSSVLNGAITSTSTTSLTISAGTKSPVVQPGLNLVPGYPIRLAYRVDPTKYMDGIVLTYDGVTGALSSDISSVAGSGTYADWQVMVLAAPDPSPVAGPTHAATSKTTPVDADELPLVDSADSFGLKRLTWANLKAALKTYFDTVYTYVTAAVDTTFSSTVDNAAATPAWVRGLALIKNGTAVATTSAAAYDFSIPAGVKRVTFIWSQGSTASTGIPMLQIGVSTPTTTGYDSTVSATSTAGTTAAINLTSGFAMVHTGSGAAIYKHVITIVNISGNTWVCGVVGSSTSVGFTGSGTVTLSGVLGVLRLTTTSGTDTFDAGTANVFWEF